MQDWLETISLGQYAGVFADNDIARDDLRDLSEDDLKELGFSLGHRKRLLRAVAEFADAAPAAVVVTTETASDDVTNWSRHAGERKPVTLLFADISGSTTLTEALDAEDAHDRLYGAVQQMCEAIEAERGTVCRFMGDGVMAMFGAPLAFEDHAARACAAALALQTRIGEYADVLEREHGCRIEARVGLHSGEVVVLQVGNADKAEYDASGANVPLAARMEQTAQPATIQMTASTFALVASHFEGEALPPVKAKGFDDLVPAVRLIRGRAVSVVSMTVPFVGRRAELDQMRVLFDACARERSGRCVIIRGEPGIGKSRLGERAMDEARRRGFTVHRCAALDCGWEQGQDPTRLLLCDLLGLDGDASDEQRSQAACDAISAGLVEAEFHPHLLDLLNLPPPLGLEAQYAALGVSERAAQCGALLGQVVERLAHATPRLLVIEDVHWAPAAVRAYIVAIARVLSDCPALMLLTTRPQLESSDDGWDVLLDGLPATRLSVGQLTAVEAQELASTFALNDPQIIAQCIERSGRNPLFLEQLLRSRVENTTAALPTSIQTLVAAQVDRLHETDKRAAQAAAVLGKQFELAALRNIIEIPDYNCAALTEHRLVHAEGRRMVFYHALVQEGVLSSLLRRDRQRLHRLAANWFAGRDAILHAWHLDRAEDAGAAHAYLLAARTEVTAHRFGFAMEQLIRGLQLVKERPVEFALRLLEGQMLTALERTADAANAYRSAAALADVAADKCRALLGAAEALRRIGDNDAGLALLDEAQVLCESDESLALEGARGHYLRGTIYMVQVDMVRCEIEFQRAYELAQSCHAPEMEAWALTGLVRLCYVAGRMNTATTYVRRYMHVCDEHGLEHVRYSQMHMLGTSLHFRLEADQAITAYQASRDHAPRVGAPAQSIVGAAMGADALLDYGRVDEAAEFARACIEGARRAGERRYEPVGAALLLRAEARSRDPELAERELRTIWDRLDAEARSFVGWWVLGALMVIAGAASTRRWVAQQASLLMATRTYGAGCIRFHHVAIAASLAADEQAEATAFAANLAKFVGDEVAPLTDLYLRWAHASAANDVAAMQAVRDDAQRAGLESISRNISPRTVI